MGTFSITDPAGGTYSIDAPDGNAAMQAFQQMRGGQSAAPPLDKYQQEAQQLVSQQKGGALDPSYGPVSSFFNGMMLGGMPTVMAGLETPYEMVAHRTWNPAEGYNYAKAYENAALQAGSEQHPYLNPAANLAGGVATGLLTSGAGLSFAPETIAGQAAPGLLRTTLGTAGDAAAQGAASGFLSNEGTGRLTGAAEGGALGFGLGAALPPALNMAVSNPIVSNIAARVNPQAYSMRQLARGILESGKTPEELQSAITTAASEGQPEYALAEAMGNAGQRLLVPSAKSPGPARQEIYDFLEDRQAGQSADVASSLTDAFGARGTTAAKTTDALTQARADAAAENYGAARAQAGALNVAPTVSKIDANLTPGVNRIVDPMADLGALPIEGKLQWIRDRLATPTNQLSDFQRGFGVKREIDSMIGKATRAGDGATVATLTPIQRSLDDQLAAASEPYAAARNAYRAGSQNIEAVPAGTEAASPGVRAEDALSQFGAIPEAAQAPFRIGFSDPLITAAARTPYTANAARPLLNMAMTQKIGGIAQPDAAALLARRLGRSNQMFQTRAKALGGSSTVENINDQSAQGIDAAGLWDALTEGVPGMIRAGVRMGKNFLGGSTPAVREHLGRALMMAGPDADVAGAMAPAVASAAKRAALAQRLMGGVTGGAAGLAGGLPTTPSYNAQTGQGRTP